MMNYGAVQASIYALDPQATALEDAKRLAERDVYRLLDELAPQLSDHQRHLLCELRTAAETLGGLRAGLSALTGPRV